MSDKYTILRQPVVAGMFYPYHKDVLLSQIKGFLDKNLERNCIGVISPHAGYTYSGKTAAYAISSLKPAEKFIIMGPNHNLLGSEFSIMNTGVWNTPLGECKIDSELADELVSDILKVGEIEHSREHSIEVQLPILQYFFKDFSFVPISIANRNYSHDFLEKCVTIGKKIACVMKGNSKINIIASSDFSHYLPLEIAKNKDNAVIEEIKELDLEGFFETLEKINASVCGYAPIAILMAIAKELNLKSRIIHSSTSGDITGDFSSIVAYYAIGFY